MLNDRQLEQVNQARAAVGKHPINTQTARQNPNMGDGWLKFWTDYDDGKPNVQPPTPPIVEDAGEGNVVKSYGDMTIDELKVLADQRGLDSTGVKLKADWIELLQTDDNTP